ncbi:methyltransferase domain-containing protein [candidate division WOR-3 bacterium]|nr:methyltransferase domain-containing protein [candidate division WOR-3 bacterium]
MAAPAGLSDRPLKAVERQQLRKHSFDAAARLYDRFRPGYPEVLLDQLLELSSIPTGGRILEIGPGTGQATLPLARRGFSILGVELGASLARLCRRNLRSFPKVEVVNLPFEQWQLQAEAFDLVVSAGAFHWLPTRLAYRRCAEVLKPHGSLALIWNFLDTPDNEFYAGLRAIYRRLAPEVRLSKPPEQRIERQRCRLVSSGRFGPVRILRHPWQSEYTADRYLGLLKTMSDHAVLAPPVRRRVFRAIRRLIADHGGSFVRPVVAVLLLAPKRPVKGVRPAPEVFVPAETLPRQH